MKRETKKSFGDPHLHGERGQIRKEMAVTAGLDGPFAASLCIAKPDRMTGGIYMPKEPGMAIMAPIPREASTKVAQRVFATASPADDEHVQ